jgi:hypothetical protein
MKNVRVRTSISLPSIAYANMTKPFFYLILLSINLAAANPDLVARLKAKLDQQRQQAAASRGGL